MKKPKSSAGDIAYTVVKAALGSIPGAGAGAAELFGLIFTPPLTKRRDEWIESLAQGLRQLEAKVQHFKIEYLTQDDAFITAALHATQSALRAHQQEKLDALRYAVLNAALHTESDEDIQLMFLNFIDNFTPWHLRVLRRFHDNAPPRDFGRDDAYLAKLFPELLRLEPAQTELAGQVEFFAQLVRDLEGRGLIDTQSTTKIGPLGGTMTGRTTELGQRFLHFITSPKIGDIQGDAK